MYLYIIIFLFNFDSKTRADAATKYGEYQGIMDFSQFLDFNSTANSTAKMSKYRQAQHS